LLGKRTLAALCILTTPGGFVKKKNEKNQEILQKQFWLAAL